MRLDRCRADGAAVAGDDVRRVDAAGEPGHARLVACRRSALRAAGRGWHTPDGGAEPLLPTTKWYVRPPRQTGGSSRPIPGCRPRRAGRRPSAVFGRCSFGLLCRPRPRADGIGRIRLRDREVDGRADRRRFRGGVRDARVLDVPGDGRGVEDGRSRGGDHGAVDRDRQGAAGVQGLDGAAHLRRGDDAAPGGAENPVTMTCVATMLEASRPCVPSVTITSSARLLVPSRHVGDLDLVGEESVRG